MPAKRRVAVRAQRERRIWPWSKRYADCCDAALEGSTGPMLPYRARRTRAGVAEVVQRTPVRPAGRLPTGLEVKHQFAKVAGVTVHWAEVGTETQATPLVLLHGLQDSHRTWKHVARLLAKDRRVVMPDLPGHGLSERADAAYDLPWYAQVIASWLEAIQLTEADVVGHSLGGGIAQMLLLEPRIHIRRLVLAASGGLGREVTSLLRLASIPRVVECFGQPFLSIGTRLVFRAIVAPDDLAELCAMNARRGSARTFARTVRDVIDWRGSGAPFPREHMRFQHYPPSPWYGESVTV